MRRLVLLTVAVFAASAQTRLLTSFEGDDGLRLVQPRGTVVRAVNTGVTHGDSALEVTFRVMQWPSIWFMPLTGTGPWDMREDGEIALDVTNPMDETVAFSVRVDDDPRADGTRYCRTGSSFIEPGATRTFTFPLKTSNSAESGMRGLPSSPNSRSLGSRGSHVLDLSHIVAFQIFMSSPAGEKRIIVDNVRLQPAPALDGMVDSFGQYAYGTWPGKLTSLEELGERRLAEAAELEERPALADRDVWGGWMDGPRLQATGWFRTEKTDGRWTLVTPDGSLFFSLGVDGVRPSEYTFTTRREHMFTWLPAEGDPLRRHTSYVRGAVEGPISEGWAMSFYTANVERKYGTDYFEPWAETSLLRLRSWGFNTLANWSDARLFSRRTPYVIPGGISGTHNRITVNHPSTGSTMHDPYDERFAANVRSSLRAQAQAAVGDPWCLGYFVDNEISWGNRDNDRNRFAIPTGALGQTYEGSPAKRAFVVKLREKYGDVARLNEAWGTQFTAWERIAAPPATNAAAREDLIALSLDFARRYFRTVRDELKTLDPNHLYLGSRFAWYTPEALQACAEFCDVVSFNVYQRQIAPATWDFLNALDKPAIIGEFHFGALDRGMFHTGLVAAANQRERADLYQGYVRSVLDHPAFVGCHWFLYADQPLTGRTRDGENYNIGFVTITDTPYPEMVEAARTVHAEAYTRRYGAK